MNNDNNSNEKKDIDIIPMEELLPKVEPKEKFIPNNDVQSNINNVPNTFNNTINNGIQNNVNNIPNDNTPNNSNNNPNNIPSNSNVVMSNNIPNNINSMPNNPNNNAPNNPNSLLQYIEDEPNKSTVINTPNGVLIPKKNNSNLNTLYIIIGIIIAGVAAFFLLYDGKSRTLICSQDKDNLYTEMTVETKGNKIGTIGFKAVYDTSSLSDGYKEIVKNYINCDEFKSELEELYEFTNCHQEVADNSVTVTLNLDIKGNKSAKRINEFRENMENKGNTCRYK